MLLLDDATVLYSASDLSAAATCEWAVMRKLDAKLGRIDPPPQTTDDMLERTARLGDAHEFRMLERLRAAGPVRDHSHLTGALRPVVPPRNIGCVMVSDRDVDLAN